MMTMVENAPIWSNTLDGQYQCEMIPQADTYGVLRVKRIEDGLVLLKTFMPISRYFKAQDVIWWGDRAMLAVYKYHKANGD